jgi:hypothetical protein
MSYQPIKGKFRMEYDPNIGESYPVFEKPVAFDASQSPKMYYRESELHGLNTDHEILRIMFTNSNIIIPWLQDNVEAKATSMIATTIDYKKVYLKNAKVDCVFVQMEQLDLFFRLMLNKELTSEEKKYI